MNEYDIRPVATDEWRAVIDTVRTALLSGTIDDETFARGVDSSADCDGLAAWDGDCCLGHAGAYRFDSTVPGGARLATAGVTRVGVLPTHTRQGILTRLIHPLLHECRDRGQEIATLHASETTIYRRFGFGIGSEDASARIRTALAKPWRVPARPGSFRLLTADEVFDVLPPLYERIARDRTGTISRPLWWWRRSYDAAVKQVSGHGKGSWVAVHTDERGVDDGFVFYEVGWIDGFAVDPGGEGTVHELWGANADAEIALWRFLCDIDLVTTWKASTRPIDEPVRRAMHDSRAYSTVGRWDDQWVRLLDVGAALAARTFGPAADAVVLAVEDPMFADNCAAWEISADGAQPSDAQPDATVDVATLSAAYLGAVSWRDLSAAAGLALDDTVLTRLDTLFTERPTAYCGTGY